ncbi:hypothetical protein YC2023_025256 [Brassica napus]
MHSSPYFDGELWIKTRRTKHENIRILAIVALELKLYDGEDEPQGLQTEIKVDLGAVAFCGDSSTMNEARVMRK